MPDVYLIAKYSDASGQNVGDYGPLSDTEFRTAIANGVDNGIALNTHIRGTADDGTGASTGTEPATWTDVEWSDKGSYGPSNKMGDNGYNPTATQAPGVNSNTGLTTIQTGSVPYDNGGGIDSLKSIFAGGINFVGTVAGGIADDFKVSASKIMQTTSAAHAPAQSPNASLVQGADGRFLMSVALAALVYLVIKHG